MENELEKLVSGLTVIPDEVDTEFIQSPVETSVIESAQWKVILQ